MAQIPLSDWSVMLNRATGGNGGAQQIINSFKNNRVAGVATAQVAGMPQSLWRYDGQRPTAGVVPGTVGTNPTRATDGAIGQTNPTAPNKLYLVSAESSFKDRVGAQLMDRLMEMSGLSGTVTTPQVITSGTVSRYTGAESAGNEIWLEIYTIIGATPTTITASYTNQAGTAGQTTVAAVFGGTSFREAHRLIRLPFQSGDTGVQSVESVTLAGTTGTAGDFGVTIMRPIVGVSAVVAGNGYERSLAFVPGPMEIKTDAALFWIIQSGFSTQVPLSSNIRLAFVQGAP
jgi:hypothetical protein